MVFLELHLEAWGDAPVVARGSGSISCCLREVKSPLELLGGTRDCMESLQGNGVSSCIDGETRGVSPVAEGNFEFLSIWFKRHTGIPLESLQGDWDSP